MWERCSRKISSVDIANLCELHPVHLQPPSDVTQDRAFLPIHKPQEYIKQVWRSWSVDAEECGTVISLDRYLQGFIRSCQRIRASAIKSSEECFSSSDMSWLYVGIAPHNRTVWRPSMASSPFAQFSPEGAQSFSKIEMLDSGAVKFSADNVMGNFSIPEKLFFQRNRPVSTYFEATIVSLNAAISSMNIGFSQLKKEAVAVPSFTQPRSTCMLSVSTFSIICNGLIVPNLPEDFVSMIKDHGKENGTVFSIHIDTTAGCVTFSIATFASSASLPSASALTEAASAAPAVAPKLVPTKLVRHSVPWTPTDTFHPVLELMQGSIHLNYGQIPFLLDVPSGASALLSEFSKNVPLSPPVAALLAAYVDDKSSAHSCLPAVSSTLGHALNHVLNCDVTAPAIQLSGESSPSSNHSLTKTFADYEHELTVLTNLLKDQDIFTALFRASQEEDLKQILTASLLSFLADGDVDAANSTSCSTSSFTLPTPQEHASPASPLTSGPWGDISKALRNLPQIEIASVFQASVPATPGTDDFAVRAASSLFDRSPPPSPRNLSPVPRESCSVSFTESDFSQDVFKMRMLGCRSRFAAWLLEQFFLRATGALLGIADAQAASDSVAESSVSAASLWQNVFANFVQMISPVLLSRNVPAKSLNMFCVAMHCAGAIVAVKNVTVSFLSCLLTFLENTFQRIASDLPPSRSHLLLTRIPSYVLACAAQYAIDKNSNKQLDPSILQYLHSPIFDGGFLESLSKWKFLDDFGSRQSGISGTSKAHATMSSFYEELSSDSKSGSLWLSIFSQAAVSQAVTSKDDPIFKCEAFKAALASFLHISGFAECCSSTPDTPEYIKRPIGKDSLKLLSPEISVLWDRFFKAILDRLKSDGDHNMLLSHCRLCLSLAPPSAAVDGTVSSGLTGCDHSPDESLLQRRISGSSAAGADKFVTELVNYLNSSVDDEFLKSVAAERDLIIQSRSFGFQILRKLLELVDLVDDEFSLDFCRSMLCCVEMCFAPIIANERGSAHVVVGLSGTNRKSQQRMQSEWTQLMRCVLDSTHKAISEQSIGSSEALPLGFLLLNLFQQDLQWLNYGGNLINDILTIAAGLHSSKSKSLEAKKAHIDLCNSQDFPTEGFAACAISDGEWLCHGGIIVVDGVRTVFDQFWFIQNGRCCAVASDESLPRMWHTLSMVHSDEFIIIGGSSMMINSGTVSRAKVPIVKVRFDRSSMSVKLSGIAISGFRSPVSHSAVVVSDSPISPVILVIGGMGKLKEFTAQLIFINTPDSAASDSTQIASQRQRTLTARRSSPPPARQQASSPPRPCIAAPMVYTNKVIDVSPLSTSGGIPFYFGCKPAVHRVPLSSQVIVSTNSSESSNSCVMCFNISTYSWSVIPLEGWPMDRHCVVGSSFVPLQEGALLLLGGEDQITGDFATPVVISLRNFSCEVLFPIPEPLRFGQHYSFNPVDSDKCTVLGNWRIVPFQTSFLKLSHFNLKSLRGPMRVRGLESVLSGLCAQAVLVPDKGFKIPVLSPLLWSLQLKRLHRAHEELMILHKSSPALPSFIGVLHEPTFSVCDSVIAFLEQDSQLVGFWISINSFSKFAGTIFSIGGHGTSLCSLEIDACRYILMKSVSGVSASPSPLPTNCWVHIAVSFLPAAIPQFCLYLNGFRLSRQDGRVLPMTWNLRSKDLGLAFGNKHFVLCVGHREGTDGTATISRVCVQRKFDFTSLSCFDISSTPPPCISSSGFHERDIGSVLQSMRSVPTSTLSHIIQNDNNVLLVLLDLSFNGSISLAGPCTLILVSLINDFPSLYSPEFFDNFLPQSLVAKLCETIRVQSLNSGSFANRHHRNVHIHFLRELMSNQAFQPVVCNMLIDALTSFNFDKDVESNMICCKRAIAIMDVLSNRLCAFPGLDVLVSPSPSSPSTRCVILRASADCAAVHMRSTSAQSHSCENHPISHLQSVKSSKNSDALHSLPPVLLNPILNIVSRVLQARQSFQDSIALSAFLDVLLENCLQVVSGALAFENSIDLSSFSETLVSQLLDLSFDSTTDSRTDEPVNSAIVDICLRLGWTVSKPVTSMVMNSAPSNKKQDIDNPVTSSSWMQIGSRPVVKSRHSTDSIYHSSIHLHSGRNLKVGLISSTGIRALCNSLKGSPIPQALVPIAHPYRRARFQITGEFFQPYPPSPVPVDDCLCFKLLTDGPRSIVSQNFCTSTEGLFCSFTLASKEYTILGLVPNTQLHLANQQLEVAPVFFSPKIGQASAGDQFRAVISRGQELSGWKEGQTVTIVADPFARVVCAFVEDDLVGAFRCDCRNMRFCIS